MRRLLLCLPMCLCLAPCAPVTPPRAHMSEPTVDRVPDNGEKLPDAASMEKLAKEDPIAFLENCVRRHKRDVKGYKVTLQKQERIEGRLQKKEVIDVCFREEPHSVYFQWVEGARKADRVLYVAGENGNKLLVLPSGIARLAGIVERDVDSDDARKTGRYTMDEFGLKKGLLRTLESWKAAKEKGGLHVQYVGVVKVKEAGDRECWQLRRTKYQKPEADGITELTIFIDKENWMQIGSILKGKDGELIGEYYFRGLKVNPDFPDKQFKRDALNEK